MPFETGVELQQVVGHEMGLDLHMLALHVHTFGHAQLKKRIETTILNQRHKYQNTFSAGDLKVIKEIFKSIPI